ncbi:MAG TPA: 2-C-methyl-D-erythritol 4-phosphate cytidylyltransferase [Syntrophobacteraceae bacterium]|nr:2-C-methyl-D-erythritol 4-phosphate cytidylyltransferase [Syntrophobacteraceae bacterium]
MPKTYAVIAAAGRGLRMGKKTPKQFLEIAGKPILHHTLANVFRARFLDGIFLVVPEDYLDESRKLADRVREEASRGRDPGGVPIGVIAGGPERQDSVFNALSVLPREVEWVLIHDGVRPFPSARLLEETWETARRTGAAITAVPSTDTVKRVLEREVVQTLAREEIWLVQTPQVFRKDLLLEAYGAARRNGWTATDDAALIERLGKPVTVVEGERSNIKVTTPADVQWAAWYWSSRGNDRE